MNSRLVMVQDSYDTLYIEYWYRIDESLTLQFQIIRFYVISFIAYSLHTAEHLQSQASAVAHGNVIKDVGFLKGNMRFSTCGPGKTDRNFKIIFSIRNKVGGTYKHKKFG